jgi:formylglycine-generating enzyme
VQHTINSLNVEFVKLRVGTFQMGRPEGGDFDERPVHTVNLSKAFLIATTPVTNAQYELFDPSHRNLRGKRGFSSQDNEAAIFVTWHEAMAFCKWLSDKEGKRYRLPTEAEWEYACRACTTTLYSTGDTLPESYHLHQQFEWSPVPVSLAIAATPPNRWGIYDMHGLVEEWCMDWYGPYVGDEQDDPVGYEDGLYKVTRGGSHNTDLDYLTSSSRCGALPDDKNWLVGFRLVREYETPADSEPLAEPAAPLWATKVSKRKYAWKPAKQPKPFFAEPIQYVYVPADSNGPLYSKHNHQPSITWCDNGDMLAIWFSTNTERGRELAVVASRLRNGADKWEPAEVIFKAPDRNMTGSALLNDRKGTLFHFNGMEAAGGWENLALVMRTSRDNGATWDTRIIDPEHHRGNQVISGTSVTKEGFIIQPCDAVHGGHGGSYLHVSEDGGSSWRPTLDPMQDPVFAKGASGAVIAGIHAGVVQLNDGSLMALGRGDDIDDKMPMSISTDMGLSWTYWPSELPPINGGQRLILLRLQEGPLLCVTFTDSSAKRNDPKWPWVDGITIRDAAGNDRTVFGMFAALSFDDGKTWPTKRLITTGGPARQLDGGAWTRGFTMDDTHAEPKGYLAAVQSPDGIVHLVSSALHYRFNYAWLTQPMPAV